MAFGLKEVIDLILYFIVAYLLIDRLCIPREDHKPASTNSPPLQTPTTQITPPNQDLQPLLEPQSIEDTELKTPTKTPDETAAEVATLVEEAMAPVVQWHDCFRRTTEKKISAIQADQHAVMARQRLFERATEKNFSGITKIQDAFEARLQRAEQAAHVADEAASEKRRNPQRSLIESFRATVTDARRKRNTAESKTRHFAGDITKLESEVADLRRTIDAERLERVQAASNSQVAAARLAQLQTTVDGLSGALHVQTHERERAEVRSRDMARDMAQLRTDVKTMRRVVRDERRVRAKMGGDLAGAKEAIGNAKMAAMSPLSEASNASSLAVRSFKLHPTAPSSGIPTILTIDQLVALFGVLHITKPKASTYLTVTSPLERTATDPRATPFKTGLDSSLFKSGAWAQSAREAKIVDEEAAVSKFEEEGSPVPSPLGNFGVEAVLLTKPIQIGVASEGLEDAALGSPRTEPVTSRTTSTSASLSSSLLPSTSTPRKVAAEHIANESAAVPNFALAPELVAHEPVATEPAVSLEPVTAEPIAPDSFIKKPVPFMFEGSCETSPAPIAYESARKDSLFVFNAGAGNDGSALTQSENSAPQVQAPVNHTHGKLEVAFRKPISKRSEAEERIGDENAKVVSSGTPFVFKLSDTKPGSWLAQDAKFAPKANLFSAAPLGGITLHDELEHDIDMPLAPKETEVGFEAPNSFYNVVEDSPIGSLPTSVATSVATWNLEASPDDDWHTEVEMLCAMDASTVAEEIPDAPSVDAEQGDTAMQSTPDRHHVDEETQNVRSDDGEEVDVDLESAPDIDSVAEEATAYTSPIAMTALTHGQQLPTEGLEEERKDKWGVLVPPEGLLPDQDEPVIPDSETRIETQGGLPGKRSAQSTTTNRSGSDSSSSSASAQAGSAATRTEATQRPVAKKPVGKAHKYSQSQMEAMRALDFQAPKPRFLYSSGYLARLRSYMVSISVLEELMGYAENDDMWVETLRKDTRDLDERALCDISEETRYALAPYTVGMIYEMMGAFFDTYVWEAAKLDFEIDETQFERDRADYIKLVSGYVEDHPADS